nr:thiol peroxidase [Tannerella forsythia]
MKFIYYLIKIQLDMMNELKENKGVVAFNGTPLTLLGETIQVGDTAPDFTAIGRDSKPVSLSDVKGKTVILSVFPSIDTGVCAMQTKRFNKEATALSENVTVLTLSKDLPFALGRFCAAEGIDRIHTLSDYMQSEFGRKYGFLIKENMLLARGVVVINPEGKVVYVEYVKELTTEPDYEKALNAAKSTL